MSRPAGDTRLTAVAEERKKGKPEESHKRGGGEPRSDPNADSTGLLSRPSSRGTPPGVPSYALPPTADPDRPMTTFWNDRFAGADYLYGTRPNIFVQAQSRALAPASTVLELGGGEGRNAVWLARQGHRVTMLDYAAVGLEKARRLAEEHAVELETIEADVTTWRPDRRWDAVVVTFLHLPSADRPRLYAAMQEAVRPGGRIIGEWFRPEQVTEGYRSGGPPDVDLLIGVDELKQHFDADGIRILNEAVAALDEGPGHQGDAAVVRFVWERGV